MENSAVDFLRMERQHFFKKATEQEYTTLFRASSPVLPPYWCCPGSPPVITFRALFDDSSYNFGLRSRRELVKGRFQGGNIAYVYQDDLELFSAVYRKKTPLSFPETKILALLEEEGPLTIRLIKEFTGLLVKEITPVLHKLQQKFLVFEDQSDNEWDRSWYLFTTEFPHIRLDRYTPQEAMEQILLRFAYLTVCFSLEMAKNFYRLSGKLLTAALESLCASHMLVKTEQGYIRPEDLPLLEKKQWIPSLVIPLQRNDFFIKCQEPFLQNRFGTKEWNVLQYLLIDGRIQGALTGKFRNGPFQVENVELALETDWTHLKEEILFAAHQANDPVLSPIGRFQGFPLI